jgi:predicted nucleic acid-binding protein
MKSTRALAQIQLDLMEVIRKKANINMVTCGNCGEILLHKMHTITPTSKENDTLIQCFNCKQHIDVHDCPDYWYEGCLDSDTFPETDGHERMNTNIVTEIDVMYVSERLKLNPSVKEVYEIVKEYPIEAKQNPTSTWDLIVEDLLYRIINKNS